MTNPGIPEPSKRLQDTLRDAADVLGASQQPVIAFDTLGRLLVVNERASSLTGWDLSVSPDLRVADLLEPASVHDWDDALRVLGEGKAWSGALVVPGPAGSGLTVEISADPVIDPATQAVGAAAVLHPRTARDRERRLRQLDTVVAQSPDAVIAVDSELRITEWNLAAEQMFGWSRAEALAGELRQFVVAEPSDDLLRVLDELGHGREVSPYETVVLHRDGRRRLVVIQPTALTELGDFVGAIMVIRDMPERRRLRRQLRHVLGAMPIVIAVFDADATVTYTVGGGYRRAGVATSLAQGMKVLQATASGTALHRAVRDALAGRSSDLRLELDDRLWQCHVAPLVEGDAELLGPPGDRGGGFLSAFDITSEDQVTDRLAEVLAASPICLAAFDSAGSITYAAGSGFDSLGIQPDDAVGRNMLSIYGDNLQIRYAVRRCLGGQPIDLVVDIRDRIWELHYRPYPGRDGGVSGGICIAQDASGWFGAQLPQNPDDLALLADPLVASPLPQPLQQFLERDDVTGLFGRRGLQRRLSEPFPVDRIRAVAVLDVDAFSLVNETYGTAQADQVLRALAERLAARCGSATLGRWHADEFVLIVDAPDADRELEMLASALLSAAREPLRIEELVVHLGMSAGLVSSVHAPAFDLLAAARQALRAAKQAGRDRFVWFSPQMAHSARGVGMGLADDLHIGISDQQLRLHYQPIVQLDGNKVTGVEALVRWQHPLEGLLKPSRFIEMTERTGQIVPLGGWVLEQACLAAAELIAEGSGLQSVAVNLAAEQLTDDTLVEQVKHALEKARCPASALVLEVTETAVMANITTASRALQQLKDLGVQLALDDFGTGYSSLLYLKHFPVDKLKIDQSFVSGLGISPDDSAIVASTVSLAHTMGIVCIAEGVETLDQFSLLDSMTCDYGQGYLFSRPLPLDALKSWLVEHTTGHGGSLGLTDPPETGPDVARILHMHADAASLQTIAAALNAAGRRTSRGSRWTAPVVAHVIARTQYPTLKLMR